MTRRLAANDHWKPIVTAFYELDSCPERCVKRKVRKPEARATSRLEQVIPRKTFVGLLG